MKLTSVILPGGACLSEGESVDGGKESCGVGGCLGGPVLLFSFRVFNFLLGLVFGLLFYRVELVPCSLRDRRNLDCFVGIT